MPLDRTPLDPGQLPPAVAKAIGPGAQGPARMMAAKGLLPLGPQDLATALYQLTLDQDPQISQAAHQTADKLPDTILSAALEAPLDPRVLDLFAAKVLNREDLIQVVLLNNATDDKTMLLLAGKMKERGLEVLAGNQVRLLRSPEIIEAFYFNKHARMSTVKRLLELAVRNGLELKGIAEFSEISASILGAPEAAEEAAPAESSLDAAFAAALLDVDEETVGDLELEEEVPQVRSIMDLPVLDKLRLAAIGAPSKRAILIKDSNKMVAMATIKSPGVTDQEAARYVADRSMHEDIIRYVANRKDWQRNYLLKLGLVKHPKCPLTQSMRLIRHLRPADLRGLARSKNIPAALAKAAKQMIQRRT